MPGARPARSFLGSCSHISSMRVPSAKAVGFPGAIRRAQLRVGAIRPGSAGPCAPSRITGPPPLLPLYHRWRDAWCAQPRARWGAARPDRHPARRACAGLADHGAPAGAAGRHRQSPFGIGDGIALLSLAEQLGRPCRILVNSDFMKLPELRPLALPIDFSATARRSRPTSRAGPTHGARCGGVTIVVFPGGGVATADHPWASAAELPWKAFTARLIQQRRHGAAGLFRRAEQRALSPGQPLQPDAAAVAFGLRVPAFCRRHHCGACGRHLAV